MHTSLRGGAAFRVTHICPFHTTCESIWKFAMLMGARNDFFSFLLLEAHQCINGCCENAWQFLCTIVLIIFNASMATISCLTDTSQSYLGCIIYLVGGVHATSIITTNNMGWSMEYEYAERLAAPQSSPILWLTADRSGHVPWPSHSAIMAIGPTHCHLLSINREVDPMWEESLNSPHQTLPSQQQTPDDMCDRQIDWAGSSPMLIISPGQLPWEIYIPLPKRYMSPLRTPTLVQRCNGFLMDFNNTTYECVMYSYIFKGLCFNLYMSWHN